MRFLDIIILLLLMLGAAIIGNAQSDDHKFEIGVQASALTRPDQLGGGLRLGYNLNKFLGVEGEVNYFPAIGYFNTEQLQGQFGVKTGIRFNRISVFGKIRPGFIRTRSSYAYNFIYPGISVPIKGKETHFSLDIGGVVEFNPTKRFFVRADIGDTIAKTNNYYFTGVTHNLQVTTGVGLRF